jgi:hypothetical protein
VAAVEVVVWESLGSLEEDMGEELDKPSKLRARAETRNFFIWVDY